MQNPNLAVGTVVQSRYVVESLLGKGGFGAVYRVRDLRVEQNLFALKEIIDSSKEELDRFTYEGELLRRLDHPSLPRVYRVFTDSINGRAYMLMDYIAGTELKILQQQQVEGRLPLPQALSIMAPIIDAVSYLHNQHPPIVHRDIKPANIIVPSNGSEAVLVDFGIAKEYKPDAATTSVPRLTPGYAAPEQYTGGTSTRTDIYALGVIFFTLLTGVLPANAWSRITQLGSVGTDPLEPINRLIPSLPMPVAQAIQRAMSIRSDDRFPTVVQFWQALNANANWQEPPAPTILSPVRSHPPVAPPQQQPFTPLVLPSASSYPSHAPVVLPPQQSSAPVVLPSASSFPSIDPTQAVHDTTNALSQGRPQTSRPGHLGIFPLVLLVLLIALGSGIGLWFFVGSSHAPSPGSQTTSTLAYPNVAGVHNGTANNTTYGLATISLLVFQQGRNIGGNLTVDLPLKGTGPFTGSVTTNNHIRFFVHSRQVPAPLFFQGIVQPGGSMHGTYCNLVQGSRCNLVGSWNVGPATG